MHTPYRILGPLQLGDGASPRGQLARFIGVLLLQPNQLVPTTELATWALGDERWDDAPQVQVLAARTRRLLNERNLPGRLDSVPGGYRLTVSERDLDAGCFRSGWEAAGRFRNRDWQKFGEQIEAALSLLEGDTLAGCGLDDHPASIALDELRQSATEDRFVSALITGNPGQVPALLEASRRSPERERLTIVAMVTLMLAGRRHEALALSHRHRLERLEATGLPPTAALEATELAVLRHDISPILRDLLGIDEVSAQAAMKNWALDLRRVTVDGVPVYATSFVGRSSLAALVADGLEQPGLLSLTGPGGVGKTRLICEVLQRHATERLIRFVDISSLGHDVDSEIVARHVAQRCEINVESQQSALEALAREFRTRPTLLVLDSCEVATTGVAGVVEALIEACPSVTVAATSRAALTVPREREYSVPPLDVSSDAMELYRHRAIDAGRPTSDDATSVALRTLCARLDGLPLAIELAAARSRTLSPKEVLEHLEDGIDLLKVERDPASHRHGSIEATIDWSYRLLDPTTQVVLRSISAAAGELAIDDLIAIAAPNSLLRSSVLEAINTLVDASLLRARHLRDGTRYRLFDTVRDFATRKAATLDELHQSRTRHAHHFATVLEHLHPELRGPGEPAAVRRLDDIWVEVRAAVSHALQTADLALAVRLIAGLGFEAVFRERGEVVGWAHEALQKDGIVEQDGADELFGTAALADWGYGHFDRGLQRAELAVQLHHERGTVISPDVAAALPLHISLRGDLERSINVLHAHAQEAADDHVPFAETHQRICEAMGLGYAGQSEQADRLMTEAEQHAARLGCRLLQAIAAFTKAIIVLDRRPDEAVGHARRTLELAEPIRATWFTSAANNYLAAALARSEDLDSASEQLRASLARQQSGGTTQSLANTIRNTIVVLERTGRPELAAPFIGWLDITRPAIPGTPGMRQHPLDLAQRLHSQMGAAGFEIARSAGTTYSTHEVIIAALRALAPDRPNPESKIL